MKKKASASLVVLAIVFLVTASLIYLFEYVSIERMMYINRSRSKKFSYNFDSIENIAFKDIKEGLNSGLDLKSFANKNYNIFENQSAKLSIEDPSEKKAIKILYKEVMPNKKERQEERYFTVLNEIFFDKSTKENDKKNFYEEILSNEVETFTSEEINNLFIDVDNKEEKVFNFNDSIIRIKSDGEELNCKIKAQGILIVEGDLTILDKVEFDGLIIIDGKLNLVNDKNHIYGYVLDLNKKSNIKYINSLMTLYDKCKKYNGIINIRRYK